LLPDSNRSEALFLLMEIRVANWKPGYYESSIDKLFNNADGQLRGKMKMYRPFQFPPKLCFLEK
jgi:hypothetical protein